MGLKECVTSKVVCSKAFMICTIRFSSTRSTSQDEQLKQHLKACAGSQAHHAKKKTTPEEPPDMLVLSNAGEPGDRVQFSEYIVANVRLYNLRNDTTLSTKAVANYTRQELATALRKVRCGLSTQCSACGRPGCR